MQLKEWAFLGNYDFFTNKVKMLATNELSPEKWSYSGKTDYGILKCYLYFTFEKLLNERENATEKQMYIYMDDETACFNTGLYDKTWQPIYFYCEKNPVTNKQKWKFLSFHNSYTMKYTKISTVDFSNLRRANYFSDPSALVFDVNLDIIPQWNHILQDETNFQRIPQQLRANGMDFCRNLIAGAIESVKKRIDANYKTIVPQWYNGNIQLLAPLYLTNETKPDLALVLSPDEHHTAYYGHTCLTMEMAYNNARLIAKPESYWLQP